MQSGMPFTPDPDCFKADVSRLSKDTDIRGLLGTVPAGVQFQHTSKAAFTAGLGGLNSAKPGRDAPETTH